MVKLHFTIPEIGGGTIGFMDHFDTVVVDDEGRKTFVRLVESTATLPEFAKCVGVMLHDVERMVQRFAILRPVLKGSEPRYLKRDLREFWADQNSEFYRRPKKLF
jgi:hypothetical protein